MFRSRLVHVVFPVSQVLGVFEPEDPERINSGYGKPGALRPLWLKSQIDGIAARAIARNLSENLVIHQVLVRLAERIGDVYGGGGLSGTMPGGCPACQASNTARRELNTLRSCKANALHPRS